MPVILNPFDLLLLIIDILLLIIFSIFLVRVNNISLTSNN